MKLKENGERILWMEVESWCCHEGCLDRMRGYRSVAWRASPVHDDFTRDHHEILSGSYRCEGCHKKFRNAVEDAGAGEDNHF